VTYQSTKQVKGFLPFPIPNSTTNLYSASVSYLSGTTCILTTNTMSVSGPR
jgi:hypothetical protein